MMASFPHKTLLGLVLTLQLPVVISQEVVIASGKITGLAMPDGSTIFYGIPYAAAPEGERRWKPPLPRAPWPVVLDASKHAPACVQADTGWNRSLINDASEDCLTVAIRTPTLAINARLPVLVYIHGGSNAAGSAGTLERDALHREGIVVVKVQYRLGAFGFLGLGALREEDPHGSSANYGLLDQIAALKWVQRNISAFGGDAARVTISGSSAGATDALFLTYSPLAKGLFQRVIIQSAAPGAPRTKAHSDAMGDELLGRLKLPSGAEGLAALRALPAEKINTAAQNLTVSPGVDSSFTWEQLNLDGYVLPQGYPTAHISNAGRPIAVIIGSNTRELGAERKPETSEQFVMAAFGANVTAARTLYGLRDGKPPAADPLLGAVPTQVITDVWFRCPARWLAHRMRDAGAQVWRYEFGFGAPGTGKPPEHTTEMDYVYYARPSMKVQNEWPPVQRYWANFIRNGNPNSEELPFWPTVGSRDSMLAIEPGGLAAKHGARFEVCNLIFKGSDHPTSAAMPL
jgi:para-nitrobenzyl esterase